MYIFVLNYDPNGVPVTLEYCWSQQALIWSFSLYLSYNKILNVDLIYCYYSCACIFLFSTIIPTVWQLCLYIFVLDNKLPDHIHCYCVIVKCQTLTKYIVLSVWPEYFCSWKCYPNPQSLAIVHCPCPLIFLFSLTHLQ